ncbi:MAG: PTS transporter subunit IIC, partial [Bacilli bacterium]
MTYIIDFIVKFFRTPALFLGFVALIGLLLQKKSASDVIKGTLKTIIGMIVLLKGVDVVIAGINPLSQAFTNLFSIKGATEIQSFSTFLDEYGSIVGMIMLGGFVANIVIARFTKFKSIYLTGNLLFWYPMIFLAVGIEAGLKGVTLYAFATILHILVITLSPWLVKPHVKYVTNSDDFTIGHTAVPFLLLGSFVGKYVGDKNKSTESLKLPKSLEFFRDTTVTAGIVMFILYLFVGIVIGSSASTEIYGASDLGSIITFSLNMGMTFAAGMIILLQGARIMLGEIVPAFNGIATKLVPGAIPALDIPMIFPFAPNALLIGFVVSMITSIATIFILGSLGLLSVALVPLTI